MGEEGWGLLSEPPGRERHWSGRESLGSTSPPHPVLPGMKSSLLGDGPGTDFRPSYLYPPAVLVQHRWVGRTSVLGFPVQTCAIGQKSFASGGHPLCL